MNPARMFVGAAVARVEDAWSRISYPWRQPTIPYQTRDQVVRDVVKAVEMYVDTRLERVHPGLLASDLAVTEAYEKAATMNLGGIMDKGPIADLIKKRDNMVAAAKITLACAVAKIIPLPPRRP